ncbi:hypothetical protein [Floridanema aerugineum]|uniref:Uncharacterized protein n=1 Tax=Floridaenema aerugineum BLCC-F46 TaxID=3153654 RepID=A0ABV4X8S3_9CYAN
MTRKSCPQNFNCLEMGAPKGRKCQNSDFCLEVLRLGGNQELPYYVETEKDKTTSSPRYVALVVKRQYDENRRSFFENLGWACAVDLPYRMYFYKKENLPIMEVHTFYSIDCGSDGFWAEAEKLPNTYFEWVAGRLSSCFSEYVKKRKEIKDNQDWYYSRYR